MAQPKLDAHLDMHPGVVAVRVAIGLLSAAVAVRNAMRLAIPRSRRGAETSRAPSAPAPTSAPPRTERQALRSVG